MQSAILYVLNTDSLGHLGLMFTMKEGSHFFAVLLFSLIKVPRDEILSV